MNNGSSELGAQISELVWLWLTAGPEVTIQKNQTACWRRGL